MHYNVSYKELENGDRAAILDLVRWFAIPKSLKIFRLGYQTIRWYNQSQKTSADFEAVIKNMNGMMFAIEVGGVSGEPVRALMRHIFGDEFYRQWMES